MCPGFGAIMESDEQEMSPVSDACQQLTEGLLALAARDNVTPLSARDTVTPVATTVATPSAMAMSPARSMPVYAGVSVVPQPAVAVTGVFTGQPAYNMAVVTPAQSMSVAMGSPYTVQQQSLHPVMLNHSGLHCK